MSSQSHDLIAYGLSDRFAALAAEYPGLHRRTHSVTGKKIYRVTDGRRERLAEISGKFKSIARINKAGLANGTPRQ